MRLQGLATPIAGADGRSDDTPEKPHTSRERAQEKRSPPEKESSLRARVAEKIAAEVIWTQRQGLCCLVCLWVLVAIRCFTWYVGSIPSGWLWFIHLFSMVTDIAVSIVVFPLVVVCGNVGGVQGHCVTCGLVGPMMTVAATLCFVDIASLLAFWAYAAPRPLHAPDRSSLELLEVACPVWELVLFASCTLNFSVCVLVWRIYKELRLVGLYPPGAQIVPLESVSPLEIVFEEEELALLGECAEDPAAKCNADQCRPAFCSPESAPSVASVHRVNPGFEVVEVGTEAKLSIPFADGKVPSTADKTLSRRQD